MNINQRIIIIRDDITDFKKCLICNSDIKFNSTLTKTANYCSKICSHKSSLTKRLESQKINNQRKISEQEIKTIEETKEYIKSEFSKTNGNYDQQAIKNGFYKSIMFHSVILHNNITFIERMYNILNDISEIPMCLKCGEQIIKFVNKIIGYRDFCSVSCQSSFNSSKRIQSYFDRTGYLSPHYNPEVILKRIENSQIKWGYAVPQLHPEVTQKSKETRLEHYGNEKYVNKEQREDTNLLKYGVKSVLSLQAKKEEAMLAKYGVRNYSQLGLTNGYKWYEYILPSGKIIKCQGYESRYIPVLIRKYGEENICFNKRDIPKIKYIGIDNKDHYYFPDFYISSENLIVEIKSKYTYDANKETNNLKFQATKDAGYKLKVKIYR